MHSPLRCDTAALQIGITLSVKILGGRRCELKQEQPKRDLREKVNRVD
jgi:hypothetical protein